MAIVVFRVAVVASLIIELFSMAAWLMPQLGWSAQPEELDRETQLFGGILVVAMLVISLGLLAFWNWVRWLNAVGTAVGLVAVVALSAIAWPRMTETEFFWINALDMVGSALAGAVIAMCFLEPVASRFRKPAMT